MKSMNIARSVRLPAETFGMRLRTKRISTIDPDTEKPMTQEKLARILLVSLSVVRKYERTGRLPHPLIRRELLRLWPDLFGAPQLPPR